MIKAQQTALLHGGAQRRFGGGRHGGGLVQGLVNDPDTQVPATGVSSPKPAWDVQSAVDFEMISRRIVSPAKGVLTVDLDHPTVPVADLD